MVTQPRRPHRQVIRMHSIDYSKISITAKLVAHFRKYSDIAFADDVASFVKAEEALREIAEKLDTAAVSSDKRNEMSYESKLTAPLLEARYKSIVQLIHKTGIKQVLELASGFSLRGLAMADDVELHYVESDLADINAEKKKLVTLLRAQYGLSDFGNHHIVTANALASSDLEAATASFNPDQPLVIVNEGLIPYLSAEEQAVLADNVRLLLSKFNGGAWITPDFTTRQVADAVSENRQRFRQAINSTTNTQLHGAAFASEDALNKFISSHGFSGDHYYQTELVTNLVSPQRLGLSDAVVEGLKPQMRIWLLSPV
ncbi:MAG: class I SAM-dependent methyltransferase [Candidatus Obscuribacterales bacterium]